MSDHVTVNAYRYCDLCAQHGEQKVAQYDAKTIYGPWANLCEECFINVGIGLGTGRGQRYVYHVIV